MEDFILREIDRIGEMLVKIAQRLGLLKDTPQYCSMEQVKVEFDSSSLPFDLDSVLRQENPVVYLVDTHHISDQALETFIDIIMHSDMAEERKGILLRDALTYLDGKGYYSFRLHSLCNG